MLPTRHPVVVVELAVLALGVALIVWGAEQFAEHLAAASARLGVTTFALALLLAGAEPEELATAVAAGVRDVPAVAFGDVVGANAAICLVALAVGALVAPLPFSPTTRRYATLALPAGVLAVAFAWDGEVGRIEGGGLVVAYAAYVTLIWVRERRPPSLGEIGELEEAETSSGSHGRVGRELGLVVVGTVAILVGATLLVEAVRRFTDVEADQTRLSLTILGLATMTLGAAALITPLGISEASLLHLPALGMIAALVLVLGLSYHDGRLTRSDAAALLVAYALFIGASVAVG